MLPVYTPEEIVKFPKICFTGVSKSGKSYIAKKVSDLGGHTICNFSDPVVLETFEEYGIRGTDGITDQDLLDFYSLYQDKDIPDAFLGGLTLREAIAKVSIDRKSKHGERYFLDQTREIVNDLDKFIIPDLRFAIEAAWLRTRPDIKVFLIESPKGVEQKWDKLAKKLTELYANGYPKNPPVRIQGLILNFY